MAQYPLFLMIMTTIFAAILLYSTLLYTNNTVEHLSKSIDVRSSVVNQTNQYELNTFMLHDYGRNINLVLAMMNNEYFPVFEKWITIFNKTINKTIIFENNLLLLIVCLDDVVYDKMVVFNNTNSANIPILKYKTVIVNINQSGQCYNATHGTNWRRLHFVFFHKICVSKHVFDLNNQVISSLLLTDIDAYWMNNPYNYISKYSCIDIMASPGTFPDRCQLRSGSTQSALITGFIFFNNTFKTHQMLNEMYAYIYKECKYSNTRNCDDQIALNCVLIQNNISFIDNITEINQDTCHTYEDNINIHFLPSKQFCRYNVDCVDRLSHPENKQPTLYIAHPSSNKDAIDKSKRFNLLDKWMKS